MVAACAIALAAMAGQAMAAAPDLVVPVLRASVASAAPGGEFELETAIANIGDAPVVPPPTAGAVATSADIALLATPTAPILASDPYLTGWGRTEPLLAGGTWPHRVRVRVPATAAPGGYYLCAVVDNAARVAESNETNNRRCINFRVTAAAPNLTIDSLRVGAVSGSSRAVTITVKNAGTAPAGVFRVDAFRLRPDRSPLLLTNCALPVGFAGGSAPCPSPFTVDPLAPGATVTFNAFVTFPADPVAHPRGSKATVEFMADGCSPRLEPGLPAACRVAESNEADNTRRAMVGVP
jgi:hypothetical protein